MYTCMFVISAIWMMPRESAYGGWPRSGEIDVCEARGAFSGSLRLTNTLKVMLVV